MPKDIERGEEYSRNLLERVDALDQEQNPQAPQPADAPAVCSASTPFDTKGLQHITSHKGDDKLRISAGELPLKIDGKESVMVVADWADALFNAIEAVKERRLMAPLLPIMARYNERIKAFIDSAGITNQSPAVYGAKEAKDGVGGERDTIEELLLLQADNLRRKLKSFGVKEIFANGGKVNLMDVEI
jgi:hypothetical protein